jgi:hypothetical protein
MGPSNNSDFSSHRSPFSACLAPAHAGLPLICCKNLEDGSTGSPTVAKLELTPPAGTYTSAQSVSISSSTSGASIHYTTDGTNPSSTFGAPNTRPVAEAASETLSGGQGTLGKSQSMTVTALQSLCAYDWRLDGASIGTGASATIAATNLGVGRHVLVQLGKEGGHLCSSDDLIFLASSNNYKGLR